MMVIEAGPATTMAEAPVEIVERKGLGHPDSICDAVLDAVSVALCGAYRERCGAILHHNVDKGLLAAGQVEVGFGGGRMLQPMELFIGDRAATRCNERAIPVAEIAAATARDWFRQHLRRIEVDSQLRIRTVLAPGSTELADIFARGGAAPAANDTSAAVGYAPLTPTEKTVLGLETFLNSADFKARFPDSGEDVKIMGVRHGRDVELTVAMPLLAGLVPSEADYFRRKKLMTREMEHFLAGRRDPVHCRVHFNTLDRLGRGVAGTYLSLLGTSAEGGDSGQVGRGNRVNGLIALNRPQGTEAAAGKNPVSHVGKIYSVLAHEVAQTIYGEIAGIREVYVWLVSRIGQPIDRPAMIYAQVTPEKPADLSLLRPQVRGLLDEALAGIGELCERLARGAIPLC
jgi:S-adenosylmethionine synthetase